MTLSLSRFLDPVPAPRALYRRDDLSDTVTWETLVREGVLVPLAADVARHRSTRRCPEVRASALQMLAPPGTVIADASAAWIHAPNTGAVLTGTAPSRTVVTHRRLLHRGPPRVVYTAKESRPRRSPIVRARRTTLPSGDVVELCAPTGEIVRITSPTRTALDVATQHELEISVPALTELAGVGADLVEALHRVHAARQWNARSRTTAALQAALAALPGQDNKCGATSAARAPVTR